MTLSFRKKKYKLLVKWLNNFLQTIIEAVRNAHRQCSSIREFYHFYFRHCTALDNVDFQLLNIKEVY